MQIISLSVGHVLLVILKRKKQAGLAACLNKIICH